MKAAPIKVEPPQAVLRSDSSAFWSLCLYIAGQNPKSLSAFANLKRLCEEHLAGRYTLEIIDLSKEPHLAQVHQIVALPTLVRRLPEPIKRLVGDLSNSQRVLISMEIDLLKSL